MVRIVCLLLVVGSCLSLRASDSHGAAHAPAPEAKKETPAPKAPAVKETHAPTNTLKDVPTPKEEHIPKTAADAMVLDQQAEKAKKAEKKLTAEDEANLQANLELVRTLRFQKSYEMAEKQAQDLISEETPVEIRRLALLELAFIAQDSEEFFKAQQYFSEYLRRYAKDPSVPEVCLRQGLLYRQMGAHQQALGKFYQVMNFALSLKLNQLEYYQGLVLKAKTEIAETYYLQGKFADAAEYFSRLLKSEEKGLDRALVHFKLIRSLSAQVNNEKVISQAQSFVQLYPDSLDVPEVRFLLADSLKKVGRNRESMQQVLALLQTQQKQAETHPEIWAYWRQRTGNEIANELYKEGDYLSALEIYTGLAKISNAAQWQIPVWYQIGLVYEHLKQPAKADLMYDQILKRQDEIRKDSPTPGLLALLDMAQWRRSYLKWGENADKSLQKLDVPPPPAVKEAAVDAAPDAKAG